MNKDLEHELRNSAIQVIKTHITTDGKKALHTYKKKLEEYGLDQQQINAVGLELCDGLFGKKGISDKRRIIYKGNVDEYRQVGKIADVFITEGYKEELFDRTYELMKRNDYAVDVRWQWPNTVTKSPKVDPHTVNYYRTVHGVLKEFGQPKMLEELVLQQFKEETQEGKNHDRKIITTKWVNGGFGSVVPEDYKTIDQSTYQEVIEYFETLLPTKAVEDH